MATLLAACHRPRDRAAAPAATRCDGTPLRGCLLPFPSNVAHTKKDKTPSRLARRLTRAEMPTNAQGVHIDPPEWNRNDGFSPGQPIIVHVASLKHAERVSRARASCRSTTSRSTRTPSSRCCCSTRRRASARSCGASSTPTRRRASEPQPDHPPGEEPRAGPALRRRAARPEATSQPRGPVGRRPRGAAQGAEQGGRRRGRSVYLAWDFTVASDRSLTARLLHIRNDAFRQLGDTQPGRRHDPGHARRSSRSPRSGLHAGREREDRAHGSPARSPCPATSNSRAARRARASTTRRSRRTRCRRSCRATSRPGAVPVQHPARRLTAPSRDRALRPRPARRPRRDRRGQHPGHERGARLHVLRDGLERACRPRTSRTRSTILQDLSQFPSLADRLQQGILNTLYLGRLLAHPQGFAANAAFQAGGCCSTPSQPVLRLQLAGRRSSAASRPRSRRTGSARCSAWPR